MRTNRATPSLCPPPARREFLAGLVGVTAAAGVTVAAAALADPDDALGKLIADWLAAREAYLSARAAYDAAMTAGGAKKAEDLRAAAYDRADAAWQVLAEYTPATAAGFVRKALALLRTPFAPGCFNLDSGEVDALIADAEAMIAGGRA